MEKYDTPIMTPDQATAFSYLLEYLIDAKIEDFRYPGTGAKDRVNKVQKQIIEMLSE